MWLGLVWPVLVIMALVAVVFGIVVYLIRLAVTDPRDMEHDLEFDGEPSYAAVPVEAQADQNATQRPAMG